MAHVIPAMLIRRLRDMELQQPEKRDPSPAAGDDNSQGGYRPTPIDIVVTRIMLTRSKRLPPDLVDSIFDFAEYWAHSTSVVNYPSEHQDHLRIRGTGADENKFLLRSLPLGLTTIHGDQNLAEELTYDSNEAKPLPLETEHDGVFFARLANYPTPRLVNPCRKIVFSIRSHDQGWGGQPENRDTYKSSWTWFEAGLERFDATQNCDDKCTYDVRGDSPSSTPPDLPVCGLRPVHPSIEQGESEDYRYVHPTLHQDQWVIRRNKTASRVWQDHVVTWSYGDDIKAESDAGMELDEQGRGRGTGDGTFVRSLRMGDVVTVWGKARFPAWVNNIESVKIEVYWAV
ncbi:Ankyrin repeat protein [Hirsutella rhossiliensis]|uniref:Ankyrin repeat protein n=1 Tax=Hirsutella rhossiliensis TaxID=111463 RepID=A0A9P8MTA1_9HYPO|nr:Ankyrin repeat protein [Hirsutella rhossiliensis]KAH0961753.1 Ankyrin repeat protein [Hirsutella rhossiliensis]